ncbi:hypothetical protein F2Q69_00049632 [Brassica cretica]|uniref:Uncharacterized protein n=1 Tax=Brassica cretica TaxID=69181 RepID=A0A8S9PNU0_BRACR|nr:hypothetical protein F2Q69_00049632 [Brassica cretica]
MNTCGALVKYISLSRTKRIGFSLSFSSTKPRLSTSARRIRRCFPFSHRSAGVVGICLYGKLVFFGGLADRVVSISPTTRLSSFPSPHRLSFFISPRRRIAASPSVAQSLSPRLNSTNVKVKQNGSDEEDINGHNGSRYIKVGVRWFGSRWFGSRDIKLFKLISSVPVV